MSALGPELPPHLLAKRKRQAEEAQQQTHEGESTQTQEKTESAPSGDDSSKRRRIMGPATPPAPLDERPSGTEAHSSQEAQSDVSNASSGSDDEDDFGPSLPPSNADVLAAQSRDTWEEESKEGMEISDEGGGTKKKLQRDEWMIVPPKQDDLAARMDPTKIRAKGFNTAKGAKGRAAGSQGDTALWTETPEEKRKRLQEEMLGVREKGEGEKSGKDASRKSEKQKREEQEKARKIREYNEEHRAQSLMSQHQGVEKKQKEDDPSKRGFDYDKDMGGGIKIGHSARKEMLNKASQFGSKFSGGGYL